MKTISCQFALKNENAGFLCLSDRVSHRNVINSLLVREFPLALRNLRLALNTPAQVHCRAPIPEIADGMPAFIGGPC